MSRAPFSHATEPSSTTLAAAPTRTIPIERLLAELPDYAPPMQVRILHRALADYNRQDLPPATRLTRLELLRPCIFDACGLLSAQHDDYGICNTTTSRRASNAIQTLHMHLCKGYRQLFGSDTELSAVRRAQALQRSLRSLGEVQLVAARLYRRAPRGLWREMHGHYLLARNGGLVDIPVLDHSLEEGDQQSVEQAYIANLLLVLVQPQRLPRLPARGSQPAGNRHAARCPIGSSRALARRTAGVGALARTGLPPRPESALAEQVEACCVKPRQKKASDLYYRPALLLRAGEGEESLLLPARTLSAGSKAWLLCAGVQRNILLGDCLEEIGQGGRFTFSELAGPDLAP